MMTSGRFSLSYDLGELASAAVLLVAVLSIVLLLVEFRSREQSRMIVMVTGFLGVVLLAGAILRPSSITVQGARVGPRVAVLVDASRRLLLPTDGGTRRDRALQGVRALEQHFSEARLSVHAFGDATLVPLAAVTGSPGGDLPVASDLRSALQALSLAPGERPRAVVVVTDGRLAAPREGEVTEESLGGIRVPVHTVRVEEQSPRDASIRSVRAAGAAVAHQPLALSVEVGCAGGLSCGAVPVTVTELRSGLEPAILATGEAKVEGGVGRVELEITLERAGARIVSVAIDAPEGDTVPQNDDRLVTFSVARDRVRLLHLAGRPTYDVRALRRWLKSDEAVDVVAFFILREGARGEDDPNADERELALIEFPVNELFTTHLPSFDAIVLQDIDAVRYRLDQHLPRLARYVESGGGLIMVGGPSSFSGGQYARTPIDAVLPVEPADPGADFDPAPVVPAYTGAGRAAPVMSELRDLVGDELPSMQGANRVGAARPGAIVLLEHPTLRAGGQPMPLLSLGEAKDGRTIALALDGTHLLAFSEFASRVAGRTYGALWDGLLGWLMRNPRYEAARAELTAPCIAGEKAVLVVTRLPGMDGPVEAWLERLGPPATNSEVKLGVHEGTGARVEIQVPALGPGGYTARVRVGAAPPTRHDFACEQAGPAFADSRPDPERLRRIAEVTGGRSVTFRDVSGLPVPDATLVAAERHVNPILPPWVWSLAASAVLGAHWLSRRRSGLS